MYLTYPLVCIYIIREADMVLLIIIGTNNPEIS